MTAATKPRKRRLPGRRRAVREATQPQSTDTGTTVPEQARVEIAPNDPLLAYLQSAGGAVDVDQLELDSPALGELRAAGVKLAVPLVSQGELIGVLNLGPRLSEQDASCWTTSPPRRRRRCASGSWSASRRPRRRRTSASSRSSRSRG